MKYYMDLFEEIKNSFIELFEMAFKIEGFWLRLWFWMALITGVVLSVRILRIASSGKDIRVGTTAFWFTLSILTGGIGGLFLALLDNIFPNRACARSFHKFMYLLLPTCVTLLLSLASSSGWIDDVIDYSFSIFCGFVTVLIECIFIIVAPRNKHLNIVLSRKQSINADALAIVKTIGIREKIRTSRDGKVVLKIKDKDAVFEVISQEELDKYLLIDENWEEMTIRKFLKASGETFSVVEIDSLVMPKICDCLAGLMILLVVTTPYISFFMDHVISYITRGVI